ncbi:hypothetical protein HXX76_009640 [Chlamydomonas incerta]|uniref:Guanylate cyclase domain-containing protein n=1 Tax=Chlamydomonas incerta TaxID=51695 RepID=A0A835VX39_CHLIN|nr:hypothetical protein HXX76_009640 [Chlamydomonas incerta]|eukprot:KAG2431110.1 hypothetical protein HXX76_009640 [Chlamydomonas incerta]
MFSASVVNHTTCGDAPAPARSPSAAWLTLTVQSCDYTPGAFPSSLAKAAAAASGPAVLLRLRLQHAPAGVAAGASASAAGACSSSLQLPRTCHVLHHHHQHQHQPAPLPQPLHASHQLTGIILGSVDRDRSTDLGMGPTEPRCSSPATAPASGPWPPSPAAGFPHGPAALPAPSASVPSAASASPRPVVPWWPRWSRAGAAAPRTPPPLHARQATPKAGRWAERGAGAGAGAEQRPPGEQDGLQQQPLVVAAESDSASGSGSAAPTITAVALAGSGGTGGAGGGGGGSRRLQLKGSGGGSGVAGGGLRVAYQSSASRAYYGDVAGSAAGLAILRILLSSGCPGQGPARPPVAALDELLLQLQSGRTFTMVLPVPRCLADAATAATTTTTTAGSATTAAAGGGSSGAPRPRPPAFSRASTGPAATASSGAQQQSDLFAYPDALPGAAVSGRGLMLDTVGTIGTDDGDGCWGTGPDQREQTAAHMHGIVVPDELERMLLDALMMSSSEGLTGTHRARSLALPHQHAQPQPPQQMQQAGREAGGPGASAEVAEAAAVDCLSTNRRRPNTAGAGAAGPGCGPSRLLAVVASAAAAAPDACDLGVGGGEGTSAAGGAAHGGSPSAQAVPGQQLPGARSFGSGSAAARAAEALDASSTPPWDRESAVPQYARSQQVARGSGVPPAASEPPPVLAGAAKAPAAASACSDGGRGTAVPGSGPGLRATSTPLRSAALWSSRSFTTGGAGCGDASSAGDGAPPGGCAVLPSRPHRAASSLASWTLTAPGSQTTWGDALVPAPPVPPPATQETGCNLAAAAGPLQRDLAPAGLTLQRLLGAAAAAATSRKRDARPRRSASSASLQSGPQADRQLPLATTTAAVVGAPTALAPPPELLVPPGNASDGAAGSAAGKTKVGCEAQGGAQEGLMQASGTPAANGGGRPAPLLVAHNEPGLGGPLEALLRGLPPLGSAASSPSACGREVHNNAGSINAQGSALTADGHSGSARSQLATSPLRRSIGSTKPPLPRDSQQTAAMLSGSRRARVMPSPLSSPSRAALGRNTYCALEEPQQHEQFDSRGQQQTADARAPLHQASSGADAGASVRVDIAADGLQPQALVVRAEGTRNLGPAAAASAPCRPSPPRAVHNYVAIADGLLVCAPESAAAAAGISPGDWCSDGASSPAGDTAADRRHVGNGYTTNDDGDGIEGFPEGGFLDDSDSELSAGGRPLGPSAAGWVTSGGRGGGACAGGMGGGMGMSIGSPLPRHLSCSSPANTAHCSEASLGAWGHGGPPPSGEGMGSPDGLLPGFGRGSFAAAGAAAVSAASAACGVVGATDSSGAGGTGAGGGAGMSLSRPLAPSQRGWSAIHCMVMGSPPAAAAPVATSISLVHEQPPPPPPPPTGAVEGASCSTARNAAPLVAAAAAAGGASLDASPIRGIGGLTPQQAAEPPRHAMSGPLDDEDDDVGGSLAAALFAAAVEGPGGVGQQQQQHHHHHHCHHKSGASAPARNSTRRAPPRHANSSGTPAAAGGAANGLAADSSSALTISGPWTASFQAYAAPCAQENSEGFSLTAAEAVSGQQQRQEMPAAPSNAVLLEPQLQLQLQLAAEPPAAPALSPRRLRGASMPGMAADSSRPPVAPVLQPSRRPSLQPHTQHHQHHPHHPQPRRRPTGRSSTSERLQQLLSSMTELKAAAAAAAAPQSSHSPHEQQTHAYARRPRQSLPSSMRHASGARGAPAHGPDDDTAAALGRRASAAASSSGLMHHSFPHDTDTAVPPASLPVPFLLAGYPAGAAAPPASSTDTVAIVTDAEAPPGGLAAEAVSRHLTRPSSPLVISRSLGLGGGTRTSTRVLPPPSVPSQRHANSGHVPAAAPRPAAFRTFRTRSLIGGGGTQAAMSEGSGASSGGGAASGGIAAAVAGGDGGMASMALASALSSSCSTYGMGMSVTTHSTHHLPRSHHRALQQQPRDPAGRDGPAAEPSALAAAGGLGSCPESACFGTRGLSSAADLPAAATATAGVDGGSVRGPAPPSKASGAHALAPNAAHPTPSAVGGPAALRPQYHKVHFRLLRSAQAAKKAAAEATCCGEAAGTGGGARSDAAAAAAAAASALPRDRCEGSFGLVRAGRSGGGAAGAAAQRARGGAAAGGACSAVSAPDHDAAGAINDSHGGAGDTNSSGAGDSNSAELVLVVTQVDVTEQVEAHQPLVQLLQQEHKVLESIFPRHILEYLTLREGDAPQASSRALSTARGSSCATPAHAAPRSVDRFGIGEAASVERLASLATSHACVTILFTDIVGFTDMCSAATPYEVMCFLNSLYSRFDGLVDIYKVYKVETIGDCYMVAGGLVAYDQDGYKSVIAGEEDPLHAVRVMEFAKAMLRAAREVRMPHNGEPVRLRVGLHSGPVTSGVVGDRMPRFCLFGDTVNVASRMESTCRPGRIHVSAATQARLPNEPWRDLGMTAVKGKGEMRTFEWDADADEPLDGQQLQRVLGLYL